MKDRRALIFWMGGIITQSLLNVTTSAIEEMGQPGINLLSLPHFSEFCEKFFLGKISDSEFLFEISENAKINLNVTTFLNKVKEKLQPCHRILTTIDLLPSRYQRWLVCEFPDSWFEYLNAKYKITEHIQKDHVLFLPNSGLDQILPDLFDYLIIQVGDTLENCLYFDKDSKRVIAAINHNFPTVVYVDPSRLEREFIMRNFIERPQPIHTPPITL